MMQHQISIFEILRPKMPAIQDIPEAEAVGIIGERLGLAFTRDERSGEWTVQKGRLRLSMSYQNYALPDKKDLFLDAGWDLGTPGGGAPCDSLDEAVRYFERALQRAKGVRP